LSLALLAIAINRSVALSIWELDVQDKLLATIETLYDCVGDHYYDILRASGAYSGMSVHSGLFLSDTGHNK